MVKSRSGSYPVLLRVHGFGTPRHNRGELAAQSLVEMFLLASREAVVVVVIY